jgi:signal transduction histidine kinase/ligand-binding sensor domain-containing protein
MLPVWSIAAFALNPALDVSQYAHTLWRYRDGFAKSTIGSMTQTADGYLWLGTGSGLLRFDGVRNVPWQPPPGQSLPSSYIRSLLTSRDGTLWIGTPRGLASWKDYRLTQYPDLAGFFVGPMIEDREGSVWAAAGGANGAKLCEIGNGNVRCYLDGARRRGAVASLYEDRRGNLWAGTPEGIWQWKPTQKVDSGEFHTLRQPNAIAGIVDGEDDGVLISTTNGIIRLIDGKAEMAFPLPASLRGLAREVLRDRDGALWVRTAGGGIVHIHQGRTDVFSQSDGLTGDFVDRLFEDREGNIWAATVNGLDRFRELPVVSYSSNQVVTMATNGVVAGRDGSIWFTAGGLNRLNRGQLTVYRSRNVPPAAQVREVRGGGLPDRNVISLFQDSRDRIWVTAMDGVGYLEKDRFIRSAAPGGATMALSEDSAGNLWISYQDRGLLRLSPGNQVQPFPWDTFGPKGRALPLFDPVQGGLWLGFRSGGVSYFRDGQVRASYSSAEGLADAPVNQLRLDGQGALWVATEGGLSRLKDGRAGTLTSKNGLPCEAVQWSLEDNARSVWLGMPCGLARVARADLDAWISGNGDTASRMVNTTVFDNSDGARMSGALGGSSPHADKSPDGKLWFVASVGLGVVDPAHLPFNKLPPPVHIESVKINGKESAAADGLALSHRSNDLEIDYTALSLTNPDRVYFRYKLEGHDPDWQDVGTRRQAYYGGLAPKHYRFRVMASNNDGVWNEAGAAWNFSIMPAFYQAIWFQSLCVLAGAAIVWLLFRLRLRQIAHRLNLRMEERINERTRIARDLHDTLLQSFQGVLMKFDAATYQIPDRDAEVRKKFERIVGEARNAVTEGRNAVQGLRSSTVVTNDLARAIGAVGEELAAQAVENGPAFCLAADGKSRDLPPLVRDEIYRIACEAIRNSFAHAQANRIDADIHYEPRQFRLLVRDNGKGIDPRILDAGGREGHHGLPGMHERAVLVGGKLAIRSQADSGTEIELTIPGSIAYAKWPRGGLWKIAGKGT